MQCRPQRSVQPIFEIEVTRPIHYVGEEVPVEGGVTGEKCVEVEHALRRDQLVQTDLPGSNPGPVSLTQPVLGIRASITDRLKDHPSSLDVVQRRANGNGAIEHA